MKKKGFVRFAIASGVLLMLILVACGTGYDPSSTMLNTPAFTQTPTLLPPYLMTQQSAYVDSQNTQVAGEAQIQNLSVQSTQVALDMARAAATSTAVQQNLDSTATAVQQQLDGTATATAAIYQTQVAAVQQTAVAGTQAADTQVAQTQQAYLNGLTTTTPAVATAQAIGRQTDSDQQAQWFTTWAYRVGIVVIFLAGLVGLFFGSRALWDARWAILARLGLVTWGPDGKPYWVAAYKGGVALLDISRGSEPVLQLSMTGKVTTGGGMEDKVAQARLADHALAVEYKLAEGTQAAQTKPGLIADAQPRAARPALGQTNTMQVPQNTPMLMVLRPDDPKARPWVEDAVRTVLDEGNDVVEGEVRDVFEEYE